MNQIFTADLNNPHDIELLKTYFGAEAIKKALREGGGGHKEILQNAAIARLMQQMEAELPPEVREHNRRLQEMWDMEAAVRRQTRDEEDDIVGTQMSFVGFGGG